VSSGFKVAWLFASALLLLTWPVAAQVKVGDVSATMAGTVAPGYSATYGNQTSSSHAWALGGAGTLSGSYYNPNFLSFNVGYYLNQSRANSSFQSITNASGFDASTNIFGGSHTPGSITYSKAYNSEGNYAIPGIANYVTHGNSDAFGVNWSANFPDLPSLSAGYQIGSGQYSVYGSNDSGRNNFRAANLHSSYRAAGFNLGAYYSNGDSRSLIPQVIAAQALPETHTSSDSYGFNVSHVLPLHGSMSGGVNRSQWDSNFLGTTTKGTLDIFDALAAIHPGSKVAITGTATYSDNLSGQLIQSVVRAGNAIASVDSNQTSNSLDLLGAISYTPSEMAQVSLSAERRTQTFLGNAYGVNSYGISGAYAHRLFEGNLNSSATMTANQADGSGEDTLGFSANENYSTKVLGWHLSGNFSYAQNVQTMLVTYMNSFYNYSGSARHSWGKLNFSAAASSAHTAITEQSGTANSSQSYSSSLGYGSWINASGGYSKASGQAIATGAGLVPIPIPSPVLPSSLISLYGGSGYSFGLSSSPVKRLILQASWSKSDSNTSTGTLLSNNQNQQFNSMVQYQFRKLNFTSGYARLEQGFSGSGTPPQVVSSFYMGASRWFKFF
jgi:hypothetical protein